MKKTTVRRLRRKVRNLKTVLRAERQLLRIMTTDRAAYARRMARLISKIEKVLSAEEFEQVMRGIHVVYVPAEQAKPLAILQENAA